MRLCFDSVVRPLVPRFALPRAALAVAALSCLVPAATQAQDAAVRVLAGRQPNQPLVITTPSAEFVVLRSGQLRASLRKGGERLTLEAAEALPAVAGDDVVVNGRQVRLVFDWDRVQVSEACRLLGEGQGARLELRGRSASGLEASLALEVYAEFPNLAVRSVTFKNDGPVPIRLDRVVTERHRFGAGTASKPSYDSLWSFHGASVEWGKDEVVAVGKGLSRENRMGAPAPNGVGGGVPVVAFWSAAVGEAIGHLEVAPQVLSLPVHVADDGGATVSVSLEPKRTLPPGGSYAAPRTFVSVYAGDFYEPLRLYSTALQKQGWILPAPTDESYAASWCGWGYETNFTLTQMLEIIPKLKTLGIRRATLDYRWFGSYADWEPRSDSLPGDSIRRMVDEYHRQGIRVQLWWLPIVAEAARSPFPSAAQKATAAVIREHPEWLILDAKGRPARTVFSVAPKEPLALLCPAVPEVRKYHKQLVEKFIRDWGFDGHKLDYVYSVPACYNPRHHHSSPEDSIRAIGDLYKTIFDTTRALKPDAVTQICSCGTPPNFAWLPYLDQAVTADPVGSAQVRRRIKMYKALLGPEAAIYGDHVELSEVRQQGGKELDVGTDFASTVGVGGVVGTKFVLPSADPELGPLRLTPEREVHWKKWLGLYNSRLLSRGTFLNLYNYGHDVPEGYAIRKDDKLYYAFFAPTGAREWRGELELRGLQPGPHRVYDYVNGKDLGTIDGHSPKLRVEFDRELLLEVEAP